VAVYRQDGRQRKEFAATFREAREIKIRRSAEEASRRAGSTPHSYALESVDQLRRARCQRRDQRPHPA